MRHVLIMAAAVVAGILVAMVLLDRLIRWSDNKSKASYDDPHYVEGSSYNPLFELFDPGLKRKREVVQEREARGDDAEADGAPPEPGPPPTRGTGPTAF